MIAPDDQEVLTGRGIRPGRIVVGTAVAHIHAFDNAVAQRSVALDHPSAHARYVVVVRCTSKSTRVPTRAYGCEAIVLACFWRSTLLPSGRRFAPLPTVQMQLPPPESIRVRYSRDAF